ncbi:restriction endonuclease subunit S [Desulfobacterium sp. N47]|uniref:restriction endonuclease subunit S n=1 Tax=Desulfobacterium sp. N47 TaxID=3115210 RepID=UPI003F49D4E0
MRKDKWELVKLGGICEIDPSKRELADIASDTLVSFAEMADLNEKRPYFNFSRKSNLGVLKKGGLSYFKDADVLLAKMTPCFENGKSGLVAGCLNGIGFGSTEFFVLRGVKIDPYLLYSIISSDFFIDSGKLMMLGTTGRKRLMKDFVANYQIPLPPLEEQKQIAALFQSIETAIEQVEVQEKNLQNLKNQLLCELFSEALQFTNYLNKNDFEKIKFEKIALNISERVEPQKTTLDTYVGLEHLDPDNLVIARTGKPDDVIGTKLKIYKGDIIFGKRRAYQRKVAVSHFDGIASAHSMILRANEKYIEKEFLPFFMQSDVFMNRAVQISEGSLSPTIKWKTLAAQEFILPKKEKQKELTKLFKQFDTTRDQLKQQKTTLKNLKQKLLSEILG